MQWKTLLTPFKQGSPQNNVLVTTRSEKVVALTMQANKLHDLEEPQKDQCWKLFVRNSFLGQNPQLNHEFVVIDSKIVEKCKGCQ